MASIEIKIPEEEKLRILQALRTMQNKVVSVATIAKTAKLNPNRSRFIIEDLIEEGRITRTVAKTFNERYIRYTYTVKSLAMNKEVQHESTNSLSNTK
jgi:RIO-like serine/threonine protein kinase